MEASPQGHSALCTWRKKDHLAEVLQDVPHRTLCPAQFWDSQVLRGSTVSRGRFLHNLLALTVGKFFLIFSLNFLFISSHSSRYMVLMAQQCNPGSKFCLLLFYCLLIIYSLQNSLRRYSSDQLKKKRHFHALALLPEETEPVIHYSSE